MEHKNTRRKIQQAANGSNILGYTITLRGKKLQQAELKPSTEQLKKTMDNKGVFM